MAYAGNGRGSKQVDPAILQPDGNDLGHYNRATPAFPVATQKCSPDNRGPVFRLGNILEIVSPGRLSSVELRAGSRPGFHVFSINSASVSLSARDSMEKSSVYLLS